MSGHWIGEALLTTGLRAGSRFPRDLMSDVMVQLPVTIVLLPCLTAHAVHRWLRERGVSHGVSTTDRSLHGCLVARVGQAIIFLDGDDGEAERRFSLAHEVAHFILDHLLPRMRALRILGEGILPVLDGDRQPTRDEMLSAVLEHVQFGLHVHLMSRGAQGAICTWGVEESEQRADRLALELLAPSQIAAAAIRNFLGDIKDVHGQREQAGIHLSERFGLPTEIAISYATQLLGRGQQRPTLTEQLFGKK